MEITDLVYNEILYLWAILKYLHLQCEPVGFGLSATDMVGKKSIERRTIMTTDDGAVMSSKFAKMHLVHMNLGDSNYSRFNIYI